MRTKRRIRVYWLMNALILPIAALAADALCPSTPLFAPALAADAPAPISIQVGETLSAEMPFGEQYRVTVSFQVTTENTGPLTIDVHSLEFDSYIEVYRVEPNGNLTFLRADEGGGPGGPVRYWYAHGMRAVVADSRIVLEAESGATYRIEVRPAQFPFCGGRFDLSVTDERPEFLDEAARTAAVEEYWKQAAARAQESGRVECDVRARLGDVMRRFCIRDRDGAVEVGIGALALAEENLGPDHLQVARVARVLAEILRRRERIDEARPLYERAIAIRQKHLGPGHPEVGEAETDLGLWLADPNDFERSKALVESALEKQEDSLAPDLLRVAESHATLAHLCSQMYRWGKGEEYLRQARSYWERAHAVHQRLLGPEHPWVAEDHALLGSASLYLGHGAESLRHKQAAADIFGKAYGRDSPTAIAARIGVSYSLSALGRTLEQKELMEEVLVDAERIGSLPDQFEAHSRLLGIYWDLGSYEKAEEQARACVETGTRAYSPNWPLVRMCRLGLAELLRMRGEYAEAEEIWDAALPFLERLRERPVLQMLPAALGGYSTFLADTGRYEKALEYRSEALEFAEKTLDPDHAWLGNAHREMAELLMELGRYDEAMEHAERAIRIQEKSRDADHPANAAALSTQAILLTATGRTDQALEAAFRSEELSRARLLLYTSSLSERQALEYASQRGSGLDLALSLAARESNGALARRAWDALIRSRALVLDQIAARNREIAEAGKVTRRHELMKEICRRYATLSVRKPTVDDSEVTRKMLADARRECEEAKQALIDSHTALRAEMDRAGLGLGEIADSLPRDAGLVGYVAYDRYTPPAPAKSSKDAKPSTGGTATNPGGFEPVRSYLAFVTAPGNAAPVAVPIGTASEIDALVSEWQNEASHGLSQESRDAASAGEAYGRAGTKLRERIWDPIRPHLGGARRVFVVGDGVLNLVSLATLPAASGGYLLEKGPLFHYVSSERDLIHAESRGARQESILALGGPDFEAREVFASLAPDTTRGKPSPAQASDAGMTFRGNRSACGDAGALGPFDPLDASRQEVEEIVSLWRRKKTKGSTSPAGAQTSTVQQTEQAEETLLLTGADASESSFKALAPGRAVLHVATHGFFLGGECPSALDPSPGRGFGAVATSSSSAGEPSEGPAAPAGEATAGSAPAKREQGENPLLLSGLVFAGAEHRDAAGPDEDDGILTAEEVAAMDLSDVQWAVLSACDTGIGEIKDRAGVGEGVFGLRRAFKVAGADTLIMSLWSVEEEATRQWMTALYEGRLNRGLDTAESVRRASLTVLRDRRDRGLSDHPFYWGAFVAAGDWR